jgi:predicted transcriptional regulator
MGIIKCVFGLASSNLEYVPKLLKELHVSESAIKIVDQIIK